jgi:UDP-N-acetylmuramoyl-tripeptide--D-alanyl-D-alanine ligase
MVDLESKLPISELLKATGGVLLKGKFKETITGVSTDSRTLSHGDLFVPIKGEHFDGHQFIPEAVRKGASATLFEKDASQRDGTEAEGIAVIGVKDTLKALGDIAKSWRSRHPIPLIGITGSNGKTTTKEMVGKVLELAFKVLKTEGNLNNRIGLPLTLLGLTHGHEMAVVEMGMNLEGEIRDLCEIARPSTGLITNISPAHLEHLGDIEGVAKAKGELFESLGTGDTALVNLDDQRCVELASRCRANKIFYGLSERAEIRAEKCEPFHALGARFELHIGQESIPVKIRWFGKPAILNALPAAAAGASMGFSIETIRKGIEAFRPPPMRMNVVEVGRNIRIIDDTYNANPRSMESAIEVLAAMKGNEMAIAILGDMKELGDASADAHVALGQKVGGLPVDRLYLIGEFSNNTAKGAISANLSEEAISVMKDHEEIVSSCLLEAKEGARILVKGSRSMAMENVVQGLLREWGAQKEQR